ncbi:MAG: SsrA-binding protein SmpB [Christensenellaceae bacterium]|jgi:SsrA-binding protein|nr:SsrA-binding protein SmpB [Christensenellaceae bacterium]
MKILCDNRKARFNYFIKDKWEAGIALEGWEVKSARSGKIGLDESFVHLEGEPKQAILKNSFIANYENGDIKAQKTKRNRKLLLHKHEIEKIARAVLIKGNSCVVTKIYLNRAGYIKAEIAVATGKHTYDKKQVLKERDIARETKKML